MANTQATISMEQFEGFKKMEKDYSQAVYTVNEYERMLTAVLKYFGNEDDKNKLMDFLENKISVDVTNDDIQSLFEWLYTEVDTESDGCNEQLCPTYEEVQVEK